MIDLERAGDGSAVALNGRFDSRAAEVCAAELLPRIQAGGPPLILDMSGVDYLGAAGLKALLLLRMRARQVGSELRIVEPSAAVSDVLDVCDLAGHFAGGESA